MNCCLVIQLKIINWDIKSFSIVFKFLHHYLTIQYLQSNLTRHIVWCTIAFAPCSKSYYKCRFFNLKNTMYLVLFINCTQICFKFSSSIFRILVFPLFSLHISFRLNTPEDFQTVQLELGFAGWLGRVLPLRSEETVTSWLYFIRCSG